MKKVLMFLIALISIITLTSCEDEVVNTTIEFKGVITVKEDIGFADMYLELENEELLEGENVEIIVSNKSTGKIINTIDLKEGVKIYKFTQLSANTAYIVYIKTNNDDLLNEIKSVNFTTKESDIVSLIGHLELLCGLNEITIDLKFNVKDISDEDKVEIMLKSDLETFKQPYIPGKVQYVFPNLVENTSYEAELIITKGQLLNEVPKVSAITKKSSDVNGTISLHNLKLKEITINTDMEDEELLKETTELLVLRDSESREIINQIEYVSGENLYTFDNLEYDNYYTIEFIFDKTEFNNYVIPLNVRTLVEPDELEFLEGNIVASTSKDSINAKVTINNEEIITKELVLIKLVNNTTNEKYHMKYKKGKTDYIFTNLDENTNFTIKLVIRNSDNLLKRVSNLEVNTLINYEDSISSILGGHDLGELISEYNIILNNIKKIIEGSFEFDYNLMINVIINTLELTEVDEIYNYFTKNELLINYIKMLNLLI